VRNTRAQGESTARIYDVSDALGVELQLEIDRDLAKYVRRSLKAAAGAATSTPAPPTSASYSNRSDNPVIQIGAAGKYPS
jgi:hypothetical protein